MNYIEEIIKAIDKFVKNPSEPRFKHFLNQVFVESMASAYSYCILHHYDNANKTTFCEQCTINPKRDSGTHDHFACEYSFRFYDYNQDLYKKPEFLARLTLALLELKAILEHYQNEPH